MSPSLRRPLLFACLVLAIVTPLAGAWIRWGGLPPGFGVFPAQRVMTPAGIDPIYFGAGVLVVALLAAFLAAPRWFGFGRPGPRQALVMGPLPAWFWGGGAVMAASWGLMWFGPDLAARYTFVPLWWGFIVALDGLVYALDEGRSLLATSKARMAVIALVSLGGWHLFEYWNYFVLSNWYYPHADLLSPLGSFVWYSLSFTTVWPVCFEAYMVLMAIPALRTRWATGPAIALPRPALVLVLLTGFALQLLMGVFPQELFWGLWIAPLLIFGAALGLAGCWTPLADIARGDWTRAVLMGLGTFLCGFVWEFWNFGSHAFRGGVATNPNYWYYDVPYFEAGFFFSQMPALGYFGYLFFGVVVWLTWLLAAHLFGFAPDFTAEPAADRVPVPGAATAGV